MAGSVEHTLKMPRAPDKVPRPTLGRSVPPMHEYEGQPCGFSSFTGAFALLGALLLVYLSTHYLLILWTTAALAVGFTLLGTYVAGQQLVLPARWQRPRGVGPGGRARL